MKRRSLLIALAGCTLVGILEAQQPADTILLPEVVVTATRFPTSRELITARVAVISGDDLRRSLSAETIESVFDWPVEIRHWQGAPQVVPLRKRAT